MLLVVISAVLQVGDLQYASPATVSRCGMVFVDPKNLRYTPYWMKWVTGRPPKVNGVTRFTLNSH